MDYNLDFLFVVNYKYDEDNVSRFMNGYKKNHCWRFMMHVRNHFLNCILGRYIILDCVNIIAEYIL
jgi:hypothetical protein